MTSCNFGVKLTPSPCVTFRHESRNSPSMTSHAYELPRRKVTITAYRPTELNEKPLNVVQL